MKKKFFIKSTLPVVLSLIGCCAANASQMIGLLWYDLDDTNRTATVTFEQGDDGYSTYVGDLVIPSTVTNPWNNKVFTVTAVGDKAFADTGVTSLTLPKTITSVGYYAFNSSNGLKEIKMLNPVPPEAPKPIFDSSAPGYQNVFKIVVPQGSVTTYANNKDWSICKFYAPDGDPDHIMVNKIYYALDHTNMTASITCEDVKNTTRYTGELVLPYRFSTENGTIYDIVSIGENAFKNCTGITKVRKTASELGLEVGKSAFEGCTGLTEFPLMLDITKIGAYAFKGCTGITDLTLGLDVTEIGEGAFEGCTGVTYLSLTRNPPVKIGDFAFAGCTALTTAYLPNATVSIGRNPFRNCPSLTTLMIVSATEDSNYISQIPVGTASMSTYSIIDTRTNTLISGTKKTIIADRVTKIADYAFRGCTGLTQLSLTDNVTAIGKYAFYGCTGLTELSLPNSITSIGDYAFEGCSGVTSLTLPNQITKISDSCFAECTGLTSVVIPESVTYIDWHAFRGCTALTSVTLPSRLERMDWYCFLGCPELTTITLPSTLTYIGDYAFGNCAKMTKIYSLNPEPPELDIMVFDEVDKEKCELFVPEGSKEKYSQAYGWNEFKLIYDNLGGVESLTTDKTPVARYNLQGVRVDDTYRGMTIVRYSDGSVQKELVK